VPGESPLDRLPHRPPFRFLSRIDAFEAGQSGVGTWVVRGDEPFFQGHFPGEPVVPGVLITEALAQLSGLVGIHRPNARGHPAGGRLAHADIRFDHEVVPPAEIQLRSSLTRSLGRLLQFEVSASVKAQVVARGTLALALSDRSGEVRA
jgi:3-hydroxyacyl-[acyl-carrier-protein] dehydratase